MKKRNNFTPLQGLVGLCAFVFALYGIFLDNIGAQVISGLISATLFITVGNSLLPEPEQDSKYLTKNQLIDKLMAIEGNPVVIITTPNSMEQGHSYIPASDVIEQKGILKMQKTRDAFDNTPYEFEAFIPTFGEEHNHIAIQIV